MSALRYSLRNAALSFRHAMMIAPAAVSQRPDNLKPSGSIWTPAATPPGGMSWAVLESTKEIRRRQAGTIYSKPAFSSHDTRTPRDVIADLKSM